MPIQVFVADEQSDQPVDATRVGMLAERVLEDRNIRGDALLTVLFVDEESIASLNERFLGHDGPTDVLSFPIETGDDLAGPSGPPGSARTSGRGPGRGPSDRFADEDEPVIGSGDAVPLLLGDVVICPEVARRNAPGHAGTYDDEIALLLVHGILHLLGMDHQGDEEADAMEALEQELLRLYHQPGGRRSEPS